MRHIKDIDILLISIAPDDGGDIVIQNNNEDIIEIFKNKIQRVIYLSTTAVYGDTGGKAIDENYPTYPKSERAINRVKAENAWVDLAKRFGIKYDILRLSGIYGNERNQLINLVRGHAKRIIKKGHVFNRIHVEDIAQIIYKLSVSKLSSDIYNISDDFAAPPQDVVEYAAKKLNIAPPPEIAFKSANLSPMARSFYSETKIILNSKIKKALNYDLMFPNYKSGINNILSIHYKKHLNKDN